MKWIVGRRTAPEMLAERVPVEAPSSWAAIETIRADLPEGGVVLFVMRDTWGVGAA